MELEKYSKMMKDRYNQSEWEIGWESLPKYIGHKIFNTKTKKIATVKWDEYPQLISIDGYNIEFACSDFRHKNAYWIYKIGEEY